MNMKRYEELKGELTKYLNGLQGQELTESQINSILSMNASIARAVRMDAIESMRQILDETLRYSL